MSNKGRKYVLRETRVVSTPIEEVFGYASDFANSAEWDPGVDSAQPRDSGGVGVGSRYDLEGDFGTAEYEVTEYDPPRRVVLTGKGETFDAVDTMEFRAIAPDQTEFTYTAEIRLTNALRFLGPLMKYPLNRMGERAVDGLESALES